MDAYDEGSKARQLPGGPDGSLPEDPASAGSSPDSTPSADQESVGQESVGQESTGQESVPQHHDSQAPTAQAFGPQASGSQASGPQAPAADPRVPVLTPTGIASLPLRSQVVAALALAVVAVVACVHLGMVFLHVAPTNTVTKQHGRAIDDWIYPEFEQNWKLFAPNPLQQNIDVQVRAQVRGADGGITETGWYDLSALDGAAIDGNLLPSHTQQNELRRAWDFYIGTHDNDNRPVGLRGDLSQRYLRRIVVLRLDREGAGGKGAVVESVQVRSRTTNVPPPKWSEEQVSDTPVLRELPWWTVPEEDVTDARTEASAG
ncbi:DUF5819 family protein [Streptomyces mirabilis]|jgi:hypothetical protein|uniref:Uncharacterized protein n=1 Tax=Streptomyces mirabilis TaxID=68239 RepID=A0A1I2WQZ3_9ACTN|nr:DUF5819 family protein [Streptomyces mirabilis]SFH03602.1 hypothetical protein SAMN02787118_13936 [Streptomyces mirabilis]